MAYSSTSSSSSTSPRRSMAPAKASAKGQLSDKQKQQLKTHMEKHKDLQDLTPSQLKSHRMKMMSRMRKGMTLKQAHADIMK